MSTTPVPPAPDLNPNDRAFLGHPKGLGYIAFAEAWERFSYYGMQTLLALYMTKQLLLPGHVEKIAGFGWFRELLEKYQNGGETMSVVALSSAIVGFYTGSVYLTPILGGFIADHWLGRTKTIILGALLMTVGHFLMAFDVSFLAAIFCLLIGVGCFKGNLASQVGELYAPSDLRRADAFQIYYLFINAAVIISPFVTGTLGEKVAWHWGFGAAGVGMVFGLIIYLAGRKHLPASQPVPRGAAEKTPLTGAEWKSICVLLLLLPVLAIGAVGNQEIFNAYMLWVPDHVSLVFFGWTIPTTWLVGIDAAVSVSALLGVVSFWRYWIKHHKEPNEVTKITLGLFLSALGQVCLAGAAHASAGGAKAGFGWVLGFEVLNSIGFANVFPVGLAMYVRVSPKAVAGLIMGIYYLHLSACSYLVGKLGGYVETMSGVNFWLMHAGLIATAAVIMLIASKTAGRLLDPQGGKPVAA
ncbi:MAG: peptide MFS transporter [Verrucomicrobia bacterium]|nr:peptide MFS transporter [Verrucomicrobiota bacterium]